MTLAHGTERLESDRLVLRRITADDLPFYTRLHALPEVAEHLYPQGRPRSSEQTKAWLEYTLASYEQLALGYLAYPWVVTSAGAAIHPVTFAIPLLLFGIWFLDSDRLLPFFLVVALVM